ncbi:MAG: hypothetical protein JRG86_21260 [Deltaproteobacteria bacterium]|jgi:hypothetical protein|nr:hypothetical protein [Deltaproteobacteria bacterium]MBW2497008.1 hypothetical protein [Deltaproteobacteria bacterium]
MDRRFPARNWMLVGLAISLALSAAPSALAGGSSPAAGASGNYRGQCKRLTRQIDHYEGTVLPMAVQRGNRAWEQATNRQIERLWHRRADLCPAYGAERSFLRRMKERQRRFNKTIAAAARAAATWFSGGLAGP